MGWERAERPGPPSCPYSAMPGTEQPCRAACLAASGLDHSCAGSSVCVANSALIRFFQLCLAQGLFLAACVMMHLCCKTAQSGMVTRPHLEELPLLPFETHNKGPCCWDLLVSAWPLTARDGLVLCIQRSSSRHFSAAMPAPKAAGVPSCPRSPHCAALT